MNPFVGLGRELRRRGHDVRVLTAEPFRETVEAEGLDFVPVLSSARFRRALTDPDLWHPTRGIRAILRLMDHRGLRRLHAALDEAWLPGRTVLVGHTLSFPTRVFEAIHDVPAATVQLAPIAFRTLHLQPRLPPRIDPNRWPRWMRRSFWWAVDRVGVDPLAGPVLHPYLRSHGLAPQRRLFRDWVHSPRRVLGFFPDWFGPPQPDWPDAVRLVGFPLYDGWREPRLDPALEGWLDDGPPPVAVTPGSANRQAPGLFEAAVRATRRLGVRALLVTAYPGQLPPRLPGHVAHVTRVPFRALFPRCAAVIHHGGIGTTAQGLAAGVPQVVVGQSFDQPDNGARLERLGVGRHLTGWDVARGGLTRELGRLLGDSGVAAAVAAAAARMADDAGESALARAADEVEALWPG